MPKNKKKKLDKFHFHEAADRTAMITDMFYSNVELHPVVKKNPVLREKAENLTKEIYQFVNDITIEEHKYFKLPPFDDATILHRKITKRLKKFMFAPNTTKTHRKIVKKIEKILPEGFCVKCDEENNPVSFYSCYACDVVVTDPYGVSTRYSIVKTENEVRSTKI